MTDSFVLAIPSRGMVKDTAALSWLRMGKMSCQEVKLRSTSLLTLTFNSLWCEGLNDRGNFRWFIMIHDDIEPLESGWVDQLIELYVKSDVDVLSVVQGIKDERGLSSTASFDPRTMAMRRLTMSEVSDPKMPAVYTSFKGMPLMPNTGLWICDMNKPWVEKICFTIRDKIIRLKSGKFVPQCYSEDWDFGVQLYRLGATVGVTNRIKCNHHGEFQYPNFVAYGSLSQDPEVNVWDPPEREYVR